MEELSINELQAIDGGRLETVSDYLLLGAAIAFAFCVPEIGVPAAILLAIW